MQLFRRGIVNILYNRRKCYKEFGIIDSADACLTTKSVSAI